MTMMKKGSPSSISVEFTESENEEKDKVLLGPYFHLTERYEGWRVTQITRALNNWFKIDEEKLEVISDVIGAMGNAFILLDDIEDNSAFRRGMPSAHTVYGNPSTVNAALYVMIESVGKLHYLNSQEAAAACIEHYLDILRGTSIEIQWRENFVCPTEDEYFDMVNQKIGCGILLLMKLMQAFSENKSDFTKLSYAAGIYFQVADDYLNLNSKKYGEKKGYCDDISEGKFSLPIIHAIRSQPNDSEVMKIMKLRTRDKDVLRRCVALINKCGSFKYTRLKLIQVYDELMEEIKKLGGNTDFEDLVSIGLANYSGA